MEIMRVPSGELLTRTDRDKLDAPMIHSFLSNNFLLGQGYSIHSLTRKTQKT